MDQRKDWVSAIRHWLRRGNGDGKIPVSAPETQLEQLGQRALATPPVDVYENDRELLIRADVPGGTSDATVVAWDEARGLTVLVPHPPLPVGNAHMQEFEHRDWYRSFALPDYADGAKATSTIRDGVLEIHVPKRTPSTMIIPVHAA